MVADGGGSHVRSGWRRDQGGSLELKEGTGGILAMCSCGEFLEIYKEDVTFRLQSPEAIDPERTNPNVPFVAMVSEQIGCSNAIIARVLLQGRDILDAAFLPRSIDKDLVTLCLHEIKEALIACYKASEVVVGHVARISEEIGARGVEYDPGGRALPSLPQVPDLEAHSTQYLISAKRAIAAICRLPPLFTPLDRTDNNFDHLGDRLAKILSDDDPLLKFIRGRADLIRYLIALRNGQEHPKPDTRTDIRNYRLQADGTLAPPTWSVSDHPPAAIALEMPTGIERLIEVAEGLLIYLVDWQLDTRLPYLLEELADEEVDPEKPIRFRLTLAGSALRGFGESRQGSDGS